MTKIILHIILYFGVLASAQGQQLNWLSFEQLETELTKQPKKVLVYFYADWCVYCKKMDKAVFNNDDVNSILGDSYYAVKFNVESIDTVYFGGKRFVNSQTGKQRNAIHDIPELLAGRPNKNIELPAIVLLDETFAIKKRFYRYIPPNEMVSILNE